MTNARRGKQGELRDLLKGQGPARTNDGWLIGVERQLPGFEDNFLVYTLKPIRFPARTDSPDDWELRRLKRTRSKERAWNSLLREVRVHEGLQGPTHTTSLGWLKQKLRKSPDEENARV
jgi:hypothetical protein